MPKTTRNPADYILPLNMNGLSGRMLRLPAKGRNKREILFVYGHHSSIERIIGIAQFLNRYGSVTVPDLPGFGGMESFYKISQKPTIDNMADYLAAFIKLRYKNKRLTIIGTSYGFTVVTRMLQKYPEIVKKVNLVISVAGFAHNADFGFKRHNYYLLKTGAWFFSLRLNAAFVQHIIFRPHFIRLGYRFIEPRFINEKDTKIRDAEEDERQRRINFEITLWQINDVRTYMYVATTMFKLNLCNQHIKLPIYHVAVDSDRYFDNLLVEQHMRTIFTDFHLIEAASSNHASSVIGTEKEAADFITPKMRALLRQKG